MRAVEHAGRERRHAFVQRDWRAGVLGIIGCEYADLHVEPLVAVDDVVAGIARDRVAAVTAKDDVADGERVDACAQTPPADR